MIFIVHTYLLICGCSHLKSHISTFTSCLAPRMLPNSKQNAFHCSKHFDRSIPASQWRQAASANNEAQPAATVQLMNMQNSARFSSGTFITPQYILHYSFQLAFSLFSRELTSDELYVWVTGNTFV